MMTECTLHLTEHEARTVLETLELFQEREFCEECEYQEFREYWNYLEREWN